MAGSGFNTVLNRFVGQYRRKPLLLNIRSLGGYYDQEHPITGSLNQLRDLTDDVVDLSLGECNTRRLGQASISKEAFVAVEAVVKKHHGVITFPTMDTGATDMADLRNRGVQYCGIGPAIDREGAGLGFGAHSDQERILIFELNRFVRFNWDVVIDLAARQ